MSKKMKVILIITAVIIVIAAAIAGMIMIAEKNQKTVEAVVIEDVNLTNIPDGAYAGKYNAFPVVAEVVVTVQDHTITSIDLVKHQNGQGGDAEVIPQLVVDAQSLQVDTISGATFSSKVILLAIRDALQSASGE